MLFGLGAIGLAGGRLPKYKGLRDPDHNRRNSERSCLGCQNERQASQCHHIYFERVDHSDNVDVRVHLPDQSQP